MRKRTKIIIGTGIILTLLVISGILVYNHLESNLEGLTKVTFTSLSLNDAKDGTFHGSYSSFPVAAEVDVTIEDHRIVSIDLTKHATGQGQSAESLPAAVLASQSIQVDTVSGATYSSVVILKAIEKALIQSGAKPI